VKIDRAFVARVHERVGDRHIIEAIVGMARALGLDVVAEGVEMPEQARWLRRLGCAVAQGFAFARPSAPGAVERLAAEGFDLGEAFGTVEEPKRSGATVPSWIRSDETTMTLGEVAQTLGMSASTVRRWADSGRLRTVRTSGGHRRFARRDVERLAGGVAERPRVRAPAELTGSQPALADLLERHGADLGRIAGRAIYEEGAVGWFGTADAQAAIERWTLDLSAACRDGDDGALAGAVERLAEDAREHGASFVEIDAFVARVVTALAGGVQASGSPPDVLAAVRRVLAIMRRRLLEHVDG
jgi:excisionase family DNA binding protein